MEFEKIQMENWPRREYFQHYFAALPCTYSMTVNLDISRIMGQGIRLYPAMLYAITRVVNRHREFRTALNEQGEVGVYTQMIPSYTVFHRETETFSNLWTWYSPRFQEFLAAYEKDLKEYGSLQGMNPKPGMPENNFPVSMIPWTSFEGFHLNLEKGYRYLLPIFTMGRYRWDQGRCWLPVAIQVHHGVCDGFHLSRFIQELQDLVQEEETFR